MTTNNELKIFLVDDDSFCRGIYKQYLIENGCCDISEFANGPDCLNSLALQPDIVFLDNGMDYLTGLEVLEKIRDTNPNAYVVFLSGQASMATALKALKLGAVDYIVKGLNDVSNITKVLDKIGSLLIARNVRRLLSA